MRATVGNNYFGNFVPLARQRCVEVAATYKLHAAKNARSSRADIIRPCTIVTICNIVMVVYHQHLHLQIPIANHTPQNNAAHVFQWTAFFYLRILQIGNPI